MQVHICSIPKKVENVSLLISSAVNPGYQVGCTYPSMEISFRSPPKYLAYNLEMGNPYPNPAMGALKSLALKLGSSSGV